MYYNLNQINDNLVYMIIGNLKKRSHIVTKSKVTDDIIMIHKSYIDQMNDQNIRIKITEKQIALLKNFRKYYANDKLVCDLLRRLFANNYEVVVFAK